MTAVGVAVVLAIVIAGLVHMKAARVTVVVICVLLGLALGATPVGDGLLAGLGLVGRAAAERIASL